MVRVSRNMDSKTGWAVQVNPTTLTEYALVVMINIAGAGTGKPGDWAIVFDDGSFDSTSGDLSVSYTLI